MSIVFAPKACQDLAAAHQHIARENPGAADREIAKILDAITLLASGGVDGREVVLRGGMRVRTWLVSSYRVYYRRSRGALQVIRVYHQARQPIER